MDQLHLPSQPSSSFLGETQSCFHWLVKKAKQALEMQSMKWNSVYDFKNKQHFNSATFTSCTHQYTFTPTPFWITQNLSFGESDTHHESIKSLWICNLYRSIAIICLLLLFWVCIKIFFFVQIYLKLSFRSMDNINMTI